MESKGSIPTRIGTQGWKQFLSAKKEMLDRFDRAKEYAKAHEVETYHGIVAEEEFRNWLSAFLPKRYGVTSGYIVSQGQRDDVKVPHFDVIVYDVLNSPVLWIEDHSGLSKSGRSQAIPAEHVFAVYEVKSQFTSSTVKSGLQHLRDLAPLYHDIDEASDRLKKFLPPNFTCGLVCFELLKEHEFSKAALNNTIAGEIPRGYRGGIILRGEGNPVDCSGIIFLSLGNSGTESTVGAKKESLLRGSPLSDSVEFSNEYLTAMLMWSEASFSMFAFDFLASLSGSYKPGMISSYHGLSWLNPKRNRIGEDTSKKSFKNE